MKLRLIHEGESGAGDLDVVRGVRHPTPHAARLQVAVEDGHLVAEAAGSWAILEFEPAKSTPLMATSAGEFVADDEDRSRIAFVRDAAGKVTCLVLNPGPWQRKAALIPAELR